MKDIQKASPKNDYLKKDKHFHIDSQYIMLFGLFVGGGSILFLSEKVMVSKLFVVQVLVICCLGGLLIPMKLFEKFFGWGRTESFILNIFGVGPVICALLMWVNFLFSSNTRTESYNVEHVAIISDLDTYFVFELQDSAMIDFPEFREFELTDKNRNFINAKTIQYKISTGILGYDVVKDIKVLTQ